MANELCVVKKAYLLNGSIGAGAGNLDGDQNKKDKTRDFLNSHYGGGDEFENAYDEIYWFFLFIPGKKKIFIQESTYGVSRKLLQILEFFFFLWQCKRGML